MLPESIEKKCILFCILDWGLGHATRSSVLIDRLLKQNNNITIVCSATSFVFLEQKYPMLRMICIEGYGIKYFEGWPAWLSIIWQLRRINKQVKIEQQFLQKEVLENKYDLIISDSRYGCYHATTPSIFIGHQLHLKTPFLTSIVNQQYQKFLSPFHRIWVPDFEQENNLSGDLSHINLQQDIRNKVDYIGPLSRFSFHTKLGKEIDLLFVLSGPEPLRTVFEAEATQYATLTERKIVLVRGVKENRERPIEIGLKNLEVHDLLGENDLKRLIESTKVMVCRSGYSSIMDYYQLPIIKYIIPTPGQTEQLYLADYLNNRFGFKKIEHLNEIS